MNGNVTNVEKEISINREANKFKVVLLRNNIIGM